MGTLIPLAPALAGLATGHTAVLAANLQLAFSVTVIGLLIGGLGFIVSIVRDRFYQQDISDLEYMLELLEGGGGRLRIGPPRRRRIDIDGADDDLPDLTTPGAGNGGDARHEALAAAVGDDSLLAGAADEPTEIISWRPLSGGDELAGGDRASEQPPDPGDRSD